MNSSKRNPKTTQLITEIVDLKKQLVTALDRVIAKIERQKKNNLKIKEAQTKEEIEAILDKIKNKL